MNSMQESAWLAGLLEGEGCFIAYKEKNKTCRTRFEVKLKMCDKDVIEKAQEIVPTRTGRIIISKSKKKNWSDAYAAKWNGKEAEILARRVLPYMGKRRSEKIKEILSMNLSHHTRPKLLVGKAINKRDGTVALHG
jgi:hypothetical protein